jgi:hypothetical protein
MPFKPPVTHGICPAKKKSLLAAQVGWYLEDLDFKRMVIEDDNIRQSDF